ncbi:[methionine synthase] reductase [Angomonas deanei]|nr:[methionine synthase] reductase [Angomonas deanei]|eukprot:EPY21576.1 [methionine synthase] reductase [Angomonas deanei]
MRPTFFQSLLRIHENNAKKKTYEAPPEKVELLKTCASLDNGPSIFRSIMNAGNPLCYPSLIDVLGLFSFIKIPLDRLLEICGPLRPRKFSVVDYKNIGESTELQLCFRKVMADREANMKASQCDGVPKLLAETLNKIALDRAAAHKAQPCFTGLVSYKMSAVQTNMSLKLYGRTSPFGTTTFARELMKAVQASAQGNGGKLILIGAGTGVAPLIAAVNELCRLRSQHSASPPFNCTLLYGARTMRELVFNERANQALREGAIADYKFALSRESSNHPDPVEKYVTDILQKGRDTFRQDLLINSPPAKLFACGPANVLKSLRNVLEDVLGEADDDDSVRQQRILFMEDSQIFFDVWSNTGVL